MKARELKNSVLQMAVQGRLVPQCPEDEPASVLLQKIRAEKQKLAKAGKIKKEKQQSEIFKGEDGIYYEKNAQEIRDISEEIPFEIPENWTWARLGSMINVISGVSYEKSDITNIGIRILRGGNIQNEQLIYKDDDVFLPLQYKDSNKSIKKGDILIVGSTGSKTVIGKPAFIKQDDLNSQIGAFLRIIRPVNIKLSAYLKIIFSSRYYREHISISAKGTNINNVKESHLTGFLIPLPPLAEQKRIAAKIEELEPLIERYGQAEQELSVLDSSFPEQIRKSVLQYAVQGRLVPQCPEDEPASVLLQKIRTEKQKLAKAGKIKKEKQQSEIFKGEDGIYYEKNAQEIRDISEEIPFEIPENWTWARLENICIKVKRGKSPVYTEKSSLLAFAQKCNQKNGIVSLEKALYIDEKTLSKYPEEEKMQEHDIIINSTGTGTLGRIGLFNCSIPDNIQAVFPDSHVTIVRTMPVLNNNYIFHYLKLKQPYFEIMGEGTTKQKELKPQIIKDVLIPLPPLAEQKRIAAKIDEIFRLINIPHVI